MALVTLTLGDMGGWGSHMSDWGAGWWILMTFLMVIFWGLVILGIVWLVRSLAGDHHGRSSPIEVLDHRLAIGEISAEEYRTRRAVLGGGSEPENPQDSKP
jgi:putative membrane protein